jgi:flagellar motor protein MotB
MAGKGGGAWKVAYADFVTAMMAFFLVMWLVAQDSKKKEAVARYFTDPMGYYQVGTNKKIAEAGAIFDTSATGKVPGKTNDVLGKGRGSYIDRDQGKTETRAVESYFTKDPVANEYWKEQAERQRNAAAQSDMVREKVVSVGEAARMQLARQMEHELKEKLPEDLDPMYRELIISGFANVDWTVLAEKSLMQAGH